MHIRLLLFIFFIISSISKAQTLYWVGGSGYWNDVNHWSFISGGTPAGVLPSANSHIVFDNLSSANGLTVHALHDINVKSIKSYNNLFNIDIIGNQDVDLKLTESSELSEYFYIKTKGNIELAPSSSAIFNFSQNKFENDIYISGNQSVQLGVLSTSKSIFLNGNISLSNSIILTKNLNVTNSTLNLSNNTIQVSSSVTINNSVVKNTIGGRNRFIIYQTSANQQAILQLNQVNNSTVNPLSPQACSVTLTSSSNPTCFGLCNGTAVFNLSGCTNAPYLIQWLNTDPSASCQTLPPAEAAYSGSTYSVNTLCGCGTQYLVLFENSIGEQFAIQVSIINPPPTLLTFSPSQPRCNALCNGQIRANVISGVVPLQINWASTTSVTHTNVITRDTLKNACAGLYTVTATNANGCINTFTTNLTEPLPITPAGTSNSITCFNTCNGSAAVNPTGGNAGGYTYSWSPGNPTGQGTSSVTNLCTGVITVTVTDSKTCTATFSANISQPPAVTVTINKTDLRCGNICDGTATVTASGGIGAFSYTLQTPAGTSITSNPPYSNLCSGTHTLITLNNGNCINTSTFVINAPPTLTATPTQSNLLCNSVCNGSVNLNPSGGTGALSYTWSPSVSTNSTAASLCAGIYTYTIKDNLNCTYTNTIDISQPPATTLTISKTDVTCFGLCDGTAIANVSGGTSPYTYTWSPTPPVIVGQGTPTISALCPGTYTVNVRDFNNCAISQTISITQPTGITTNTTATSPSCNNSCNGVINANPTGGNGAPYTFTLQIPGGGTNTNNPPFNGLCAGTYTLLIRDNGGCVRTNTITLTNPNAINLSLNPTQLNCFGQCNGSIASVVSGGTPSYTVSWSVGGTGGTKTGLCAGVYSATVTDSKGCQATATTTITAPPQLAITITSVAPNCFGQCNGLATASVTGGTPNYTVTWNNGNIGNTNSNLCQGTYTATAIDFKGCTQTQTTSIIAPPALTLTTISDTTSCFGICDGAIIVNPNGGTPGYFFNWNTVPTQTTQTATGLCQGNYNVTVTDSKGCTSTHTASVSQPTVLTASINNIQPSCNVCIGSATANGNGGTTPYTYSWSNGSNTQTANNLCIGVQTVTITDSKNCTATATAQINQAINITITSSSNTLTCNNTCSGIATANANGGLAPYTYTWSPSPTQNTQTATNLCVGTHTVVVEDANGCSNSSTINFVNPPAITLTVNQTNVTCNGVCNGSASVTATGGTGTFSYLWQPGNLSTSSISNLCAGDYTVIATDANNCSQTQVVTITENNALSVLFTSVDPSSCASNNGSISFTVSGGTPAYTHTWLPGNSNSNPLTNLADGTYTLNVRDLNGCTTSFTTTLSDPVGPTVVANTNTITCFGLCNGSATLSITASTPGYTVSWPALSSSSETVTNLCAGNYVAVVTDDNSCITNQTVNISAPNQISATGITSNINCNAACSGSINLTTTGGTGTYNYSWLPSTSNAEDPTNLCAGIQTVTITDGNSCSVTNTFSVNEPTPLSLSFNKRDVLCNGGCTGSVKAVVSGGSGSYTYTWTPLGSFTGSVLDTIVNLCTGVYSVSVLDLNGCSISGTVNIGEPTALAGTVTPTDAKCNNQCNGAAVTTVTGGTSPYNYSYNTIPVITNSIVTNLCAGNYISTVTDANGCALTNSFTINQPLPITITTTLSNPKCNAACDGSVTTTVSGGNSGYNYNWIPSGSGANAVGLCSGNYTLTVTDDSLCTAQVLFSLTNPTSLIANISFTNPNCGTNCNGIATANPTGGTGSLSYTWAPVNINTQTATGLCAGIYTLTVSDDNACQVTQTTTLTAPSSLNINPATTPASCGASNGSIDASAVIGGTPGYTYNWLPPVVSTNTVVSGLAAGVYSVVVTDAASCSSTITIPLANSNGPSGATIVTTDVDCAGQCNGTASISNPIGGTAPYTLSWLSPVSNNTLVTGLCAGNYTAQVSDANNCLLFLPATIVEPQTISANEVITSSQCFGNCNGAITLAPTGGNGGYSYVWTPSGNTTNSVNGLCPGDYTVTVTDSKNCSYDFNYNIPSVINITANTVVTNNSCYDDCNATALVTNIAGGTPQYSIVWNDPLGQTSNQAVNLCTGTYSVTITDANGCFNRIPANIIAPSKVTFTSNITQPTCGQCDGAITISPSGGIPNYSTIWSNNQTGNSASNLCAGVYLVQITDANGCQSDSNIVINSSSTITGENITKADLSCSGVCDGSVTVTAIGGTAPISYNWVHNGSNSQSLTGLCAGTYFCNMTDANGCSRTASVTINATTSLSITSQVTQSSCSASTGSIAINVTGGSGTYSYAWAPASVTSTTNSATNLAPGSYSVTVSDGTCSQLQVFSMSAINGPVITFTKTDISCASTCNGSIALTISGGTPNYNINWSTGASTSSVSSLCAGNYSVIVTDAAGCSSVQNFSLNAIPTIAFSTPDLNNPLCNNNCNGSISAVPSGGTLPYTFSWSPNTATALTATALCSGNYTFSVTDANGCNASQSYSLSGPPPIAITATLSDVTCNGLATGSINLSVTGGVPGPGYTYTWTPNNVNNEDLNGITVGTYTVAITDNNGCTIDSSFVINEPLAIIANETITAAQCFGNCNGSISLNPSGGNGSYTYSWTPSATTSVITNQCPGFYTSTITDSKGCTLVSNFNIPSLVTITSVVNTTNNVCYSDCNGIATATNIAGGASPYTLQWNDPLGQVGNTANGLCTGTYSVTITDANGCFNRIPANIIAPSKVTFTSNITQPTCGQCDGAITISPSGGIPNYSTIWSNNQTGNSASNLCAGVYLVQITDANGCQSDSNIVINSSSTITGENITKADLSCSGVCDGSVSVTAIGGTAPISYNWVHNGSNSQSLTGLCAGTYFCNMTDANGCSRTASVTINATTSLSITSQVTQSSCSASTGSIAINVTGGSGTYSYAWAPASVTSTTNSATNLAPGSYSVTVSDGTCSQLQVFSMSAINGPVITFTKTDISCASTCNGNIALTISGGTPNYNINWSTGATTSSVSSLCAGNYSVIVSDAAGCSSVQNFSLNAIPTIAFSTPDLNNPLCNNNCNGSITAVPSGGTLPYTFSWSPNTATALTATALCSGNYTFSVTDANGCNASQSYSLSGPPPIAITATTIPSSCSTVADASIDITVTGGVPIYSYSWSPNSALTEDLIPTLSGTYTITITDANNCQYDSVIQVGTNNLVDAVAGNDTTFCQNSTLTLNGSNSVGGDNYQWQLLPAGTVISNTLITIVAPAVGTNTYVLIATTNVGCNDRDTIIVTSNALPVVDAGPMVSIPLLATSPIGGSPTSPTAINYTWTPNLALDNPSSTNPTTSTTVTTIYTVTVVDANGCINSDTVTVYVFPEIKIPNGFSPNGDGKNDTWMIDFIQQFPDCEVEVYNRWGEQLFYSRGYATTWNGQYKGKNLPVGTYYYVVKLNNEKYPDPYTGPLTIFR